MERTFVETMPERKSHMMLMVARDPHAGGGNIALKMEDANINTQLIEIDH